MKIDKYKARIEFYCDDDTDRLAISYDNRGEPYSEGITLELGSEYQTITYVYLEKREALRLAKLVMELYGPPKGK